jgi:hypothetical protein
MDHLVPPRGDVNGAALEARTLLAALAAQTSRLRPRPPIMIGAGGERYGHDLSRFPGPAAARELLIELIDADARHLVLAPIGMPSVQWTADEIIEPVLAAAGLA